MAYIRKTMDCWRFYVNYGRGWEYETMELTREMMKINKKAYAQNSNYPFKVVKGRTEII